MVHKDNKVSRAVQKSEKRTYIAPEARIEVGWAQAAPNVSSMLGQLGTSCTGKPFLSYHTFEINVLERHTAHLRQTPTTTQ